MSKYARFIWRNENSDHSIQLIDAIDLSSPAYPQLPALGCKNEAELLSKLYQPSEAQWRADDEWFLPVPSGVQDGATYVGAPGDEANPINYHNPDGTYGDGTPISVPQ